MALQNPETSPASVDRCSLREQSNETTNRVEGTESGVADELPQSLQLALKGSRSHAPLSGKGHSRACPTRRLLLRRKDCVAVFPHWQLIKINELVADSSSALVSVGLGAGPEPPDAHFHPSTSV